MISPALEVAVQDAAGVRVAKEIGAARVELTHGLALGGVTPSPATLELAVEASGEDGPGVHVLVRPRAGGFHYDAEEIEASVRDVRWMLAHGAAGVVVGAQTASGELDVPALVRLRDAARSVRDDAEVTLHRAIDVTPDPLAALETARELGFTRVLTSGGASVVMDGLDVLRALIAAAAGRIQVMAGSGVTAGNAAALAATGVDALHFSAKRMVSAGGEVRMGSAADGGGGHEVTDLAEARAVRAALGF
ncbi:copper homeostasis protein CutC [Microbacterium sp. ASV81]|uniref:PF03932 family protein CutC n=1 Tax=Microbacterium capsulatum TaxID=3041921 RepID=A0ABU0XLQ0_9MICO|nr:copper homeostasis protein CutC [Microbacterium sp. ASV81]MDQ4215539.1 copper homeostasis protein CutC [Microbacterium sp. ASV81]